MYVVTTVRLRADQWRALHEEAFGRVGEGGGRVDASAVVRDAIDLWLAAKKKATPARKAKAKGGRR
jgi:Arc/MetJ-type ribon-helix-helix transcriptional regulator